MSWVRPPFISERQAGTWVDCVDCSGLMATLGNRPGIAPATLAEAKALRATAGFPATGGTSIGPITLPSGVKAEGMAAAMRQRYGVNPVIVGTSFADFWAALTPGHSAVAIVKPSLCASTSPIRRFQGSFAGLHGDHLSRLDSTDRAWLMDPCGPTSGWHGEWVSKADIARCYVGQGAVLPLARLVVAKSMVRPALPRSNVTFGPALGPTLPAGTKLGVIDSVAGNRWYFGTLTGTKWYAATQINGRAVSALYPGHTIAWIAAGAVLGG